jgi:hypothetical protein
MDACKLATTPLDMGARLSKNQGSSSTKKEVTMVNIPHRRAISSLMYWMDGMRPYIATTIGIVT